MLSSIGKKQIYWTITIFLSIVAYFLPLGEVYTPTMKKFFAITVFGLCLLAFELANNFAIGMFLPVAWICTGVADFATAFSPYLSTNFFLLMNAFLFAGIMSKTGLLQRIGYALLTKFGGTYNSAIWALFLIGTVLSFISMMNAYIIICTIALALAKALNISSNDKAAVPIFTAVIVTVINSKVICYSPISISILNSSLQTVMPGFSVDFFTLVLHNWPMYIFCVFFLWLTLKWYEKANKKENTSFDLTMFKEQIKAAYQRLGNIKKEEKICAAVLFGVFVWMLFYSLGFLKFDVVYAFLCANILLFVLNIADQEDLKSINVGTLVVVMAFVAVGSVATSIQATALISTGVSSIFGGIGNYWSSLGSLLFGVISNFILTPYAMMAMLPSVIASYCIDLGWTFLPNFNACYLASDMIFLPYEYPLALICFGFGICNMANVVKMLSLKTIGAIAFVVLIMMPYWKLLGLYG